MSTKVATGSKIPRLPVVRERDCGQDKYECFLSESTAGWRYGLLDRRRPRLQSGDWFCHSENGAEK